jgi:DNA-directed RNA polymerase subunit RPC12/RpoP
MNCKCSAPLADGFYVCTTCGESLAYALAEVDGVVEVLDAGVARTSLTAGYGERVSSSGPLHAPLPINEAVFDARRALHTYLMRTALKLAEVAGPLSSRSSQGLAAYLITNLNTLRRQDWAAGVEAELRKLLRKAVQATQPPGERINVGECGATVEEVLCTNPLNPLKTQETIQCRVCGTTWDVKHRQRDAIGAAWNAVGPPPLIIKALAQYGIHVRMDSFKNWVKLGHLKPVNNEGRKEYRVNEVWAVAKRMKERRKAA